MSIQQQLQQELVSIALKSFDEYCRLTGTDPVRSCICLLRSKGKSWAQIGITLKMDSEKARGIYRRKCGRKQP